LILYCTIASFPLNVVLGGVVVIVMGRSAGWMDGWMVGQNENQQQKRRKPMSERNAKSHIF
jgi:hypothetical protein